MKRRIDLGIALLAGALVASSCGGGGASSNVLSSVTTSSSPAAATAVPATSVAAVVPATTPEASVTSTSFPPPDGPWQQEDLPHVVGVAPVQLAQVALVDRQDVLNARLSPGVDSEVYVGLVPEVTVILTGAEEVVSGSVWSEIDTYVGPLWVNSHFLAAFVARDVFRDDSRVADLIERFAEIIANRGDLRPVVSRRGLYVSHHDAPRRFRASTLETILSDPTTYFWASTGASASEIESSGAPGRTFTEEVADSFVGAYGESDTVTTINEPITGGNGRLAADAIPFELQLFNYVGVHDPGDDPQFDGLDWTTWYVSIDYENGSPVIVALTLDQWSP